MRHDFKFFIREGAGNMFSHGFMSFAAIGITVACLLIMGTFTLVAYNANVNLADLQQENAVLAFVDDALTEQYLQTGALEDASGLTVPPPVPPAMPFALAQRTAAS